MKVGIDLLMALVIGAFFKLGMDVQAAIEAGKSDRAVVLGAIPMFLVGAVSLFALSKNISHMAKAETTESEASNV